MRNKSILEKTIKVFFILSLFFILFFSAALVRADDSTTNNFLNPDVPVGTVQDGFEMGADREWHAISPSTPTTTAPTPADTTANKGAGLELVYPQIPGAITPEYISIGIPRYVEYLFKLAVWAIGIIIFLVLLYHGFVYFTSVGDPGKLTDAIDGIKSAGLGAIILLSAYLIFNTINPQLTILNAPDVPVLAPNVSPGIYLCNYKVTENLKSIIEDYMNIDDESEDQKLAGIGEQIRIEAAEKLGALMIPRDKNKLCFRVHSSGDLTNFYFNGKEDTIFSIPRKIYITDPADPTKTKPDWAYDYGIILHGRDLRKGVCAVANIYGAQNNENIKRVTGARSITLFTKSSDEPPPTSQGIILYQCVNYNDPKKCPAGVITPALGVFPQTSMPNGRYYDKFELPDLQKLKLGQNTRSIKFDQEGSYFAILSSGKDEYEGDICEVISSDDPDLTNNPIGQCRKTTGQRYVTNNLGQKVLVPIETNTSCLQSMIVIKGKVL